MNNIISFKAQKTKAQLMKEQTISNNSRLRAMAEFDRLDRVKRALQAELKEVLAEMRQANATMVAWQQEVAWYQSKIDQL